MIFLKLVEITVDQMYQIENNGHDMGFLKKFMKHLDFCWNGK
jgi:hypothetical protein